MSTHHPTVTVVPPEEGPELLPAPGPRPRRRWQPLLFVLTCLSTYAVGGWQYAVTLMLILLTHEMGHYLMARRHRVEASLPYFIPMPLTLLGTLGAVIITRDRFPTRREIFDVGVAGPIAGFVIAVPAWILGLKLSTVTTRDAFLEESSQTSIEFGDSLLTWLTTQMFYPGLADDAIIVAHPIALAAWVGLFVTALNLIPAGSLDGGHVSYALWWRNHRRLSLTTALVLVAFGLGPALTGDTELMWRPRGIPIPINPNELRPVWLFWALLIRLLAMNHPPPIYPEVPITRGRIWVAGLALCIFILTFTPDPIRIEALPEERTETHELEPEHPTAPEREYAPEQHRDPRRGDVLDV